MATSVADVLAKRLAAGSSGAVRGWVRSVRRHKRFSFVQVGDGSSWDSLQAVVATEQLPASLTTGSSVRVAGKVAEGRDGAVELAADEVELVGECDQASYPLQKKYHSPEFLREIMHLRPRSNRFAAVLRARSTAALALNNFFDEQGFVQVNTPILTSTDCEGAGEMFRVRDPFEENRDRFLTVSGQLHAEMFATALSKVYTFGPTFRAENSNTARHLCEFYMIEPEVAFHTLEDSMDLAEQSVKTALRSVFERRAADVGHLFSDDAATEASATGHSVAQRLADATKAMESEWVRMTYDEAVDTLTRSGKEFAHPVKWGLALQSEHERYLSEELCGRTPVFVTHYPRACKAFYMKRVPASPDTVACFDLLVPRIGELIGGSEREDDLELLQDAARQAGVNAHGELDWYFDLRRYGSVPHAGWGMGFERLIQFATGVENIRDVIPVPRSPGMFEY
mmetsp:Transcript_1447/g.3574  ORF Transcript_1447/g.3574 Transcript_1447/m.3574 type:complete len:454 (-) Transcript_1447:426-1787(-)